MGRSCVCFLLKVRSGRSIFETVLVGLGRSPNITLWSTKIFHFMLESILWFCVPQTGVWIGSLVLQPPPSHYNVSKFLRRFYIHDENNLSIYPGRVGGRFVQNWVSVAPFSGSRGTLRCTNLTTPSTICVEHNVIMLPLNLLNSLICITYSVVAARYFYRGSYQRHILINLNSFIIIWNGRQSERCT